MLHNEPESISTLTMLQTSACRFCGTKPLQIVFDLGHQSVASIFPSPVDNAAASCHFPPSGPLSLARCPTCLLVQLAHTLDCSTDMFLRNSYGYRSGINDTMTKHLHGIALEALHLVSGQIKEGDIILDIGSNDATLLNGYKTEEALSILKLKSGIPSNLTLLGIDPVGEQFKSYYSDNSIELVSDFFNKEAYMNFQQLHLHCIHSPAMIITSIAIFYNLENPIQTALDVRDCLHKEGVWIMEQSYLPTMLRLAMFDTICHEHLEYYCLRDIEYVCRRTSLRILKVSFNDCNGGSFRVTLCHLDSSHQSSAEDEVLIQATFAAEDICRGSLDLFNKFNECCQLLRTKLTQLIKRIKNKGQTIYLYGASTKGNTLLQYCNLDASVITAASEKNEIKIGKRTPATNIPIVTEEEARRAQPDYLLVLPWHFRSEFLTRESSYLEGDGHFIFPLPTLTIVGKSGLLDPDTVE